MNLSVKLGRLKLKNPVSVASGTFGYAEEFKDLVCLEKLGAIITKTITRLPKQGNPPPRLVETAAGMLNSIGLQNEGLDNFIKVKLPLLKKIKTKIIVSIGGTDAQEFVYLAQRLEDAGVEAIELNLSCPNIKYKGSTSIAATMLAHNIQDISKIVSSVCKKTKIVVIPKLSPNVTDIVHLARAAEDAGAQAVSLVNTFLAMAIDIKNYRPKLKNVTGGLSGPAIKPIALRIVYELAKAVKIPVLGMGGIMSAEDALEFMIAGATAVGVGTANFVNPHAAEEIINGLGKYLKEKKIKDINKIIGIIKT